MISKGVEQVEDYITEALSGGEGREGKKMRGVEREWEGEVIGGSVRQSCESG